MTLKRAKDTGGNSPNGEPPAHDKLSRPIAVRGEQPQLWGASPRIWKLSRKLTPQFIDYFLKVRSGKGMPEAARSRFEAMRIPALVIDRALGEIHQLDDWVGSWSRAAQRFMTEARREEAAGEWESGAIARRNAAMCYHVAHLITEDDPRTVRSLRASAVKSFSLSLKQLNPGTVRVGIPWRTYRLPGYLSIPLNVSRPAPLTVILNGATTTKEETFVWCESLRNHGHAVLNLDWPGTGEATDGQRLTSFCDDMTDGLLELAEYDERIDQHQVSLLGISLGGVVALRAAAMDRRISAVTVVTPPFDPRPWVSAINPVVARQLVSLAGRAPSVPVLLEDFALPNVVSRVQCPVLVFGGARDLVVPPDESTRLAASLDDLATLVWYPDGGHGLYDRVDDWLGVTARWLDALYERNAVENRFDVEQESTEVDPGQSGVSPGELDAEAGASPPGEDAAEDAEKRSPADQSVYPG